MSSYIKLVLKQTVGFNNSFASWKCHIKALVTDRGLTTTLE